MHIVPVAHSHFITAALQTVLGSNSVQFVATVHAFPTTSEATFKQILKQEVLWKHI